MACRIRNDSEIIASRRSVRYTISMSSKAGFRITSYKPIGWVFAFVLSVTQVYPAFGVCICLREARETIEVSISSDDPPSCRSAAAWPATREETDSGSGRCSKETDPGDSNTRISRDDCCGVDGGWTPPLPASLSRTVEIRPEFDAMPWIRTEETCTLVRRIEGLTRDSGPGIHTGSGTTLYLINASLLI